MNVYEVGFYGSPKSPDDEDTLYLVRAESFDRSVDIVGNYHSKLSGIDKIPDFSYEIGIDSGSGDGESILRGPYYLQAINPGWPAWYPEDDSGDLVGDKDGM